MNFSGLHKKIIIFLQQIKYIRILKKYIYALCILSSQLVKQSNQTIELAFVIEISIQS